MTSRPRPSEYVPYFADYVSMAEDDPVTRLTAQAGEVAQWLDLDDTIASTPPAPGEWSLKEILVHLCDFERVFNYRALRFSRGDGLPIEAFEQDAYIAASGANLRPLPLIVTELLSLRAATVVFFGGMTEEMLDRVGTAGGNPVSVRALVFITAGHCEGHLRDIRSMLA